MTISTTISRISHNGNGVTTAFSFPYRFLQNADLVVIRVNADATETTLVLNTDYTLAGADADAGGTVTCTVAPASGTRLVIFRSVEATQEVDYITGDSFPAETHERALDRLTMVAQQLQDAVDRSAKLSETSTADADTLVANINSLAAIEDDVSAVAGIVDDVTDVAAIDTNVTTVAGIAANVTTVAGIAANVTTVAGNTSNINTVAGIDSDVSTVAGIAADVTAVAAIDSDVTAVAADATDIGIVATNIDDVVAVAADATDIGVVATNIDDVNTVATNIVDIQNAEENADAAIAAKVAAEAARDATLAAYDSFDDRYLGAKASDPTLDNDGNALLAGSLYYNTTVPEMRLYTGSAWVAAYVSGAAYLASANNLSDLANAATARTNLGLAIGTDVQAYDADTAKTDVAQTFTAKQIFFGSSSVASMKTSNIAEVDTIAATAATGVINYDVATQSVLFYTTDASGNWTVNFRGSSGTSLDALMATGESISVTFLVTQGSTAYYNSAVTVDGSSVTPKWQGGSAPTSGNASSVDCYTYVIQKTGAATYVVLASQTQFA